MNRDHMTVVAGVYDPLSARIAEDAGFECVGIGGYAVGACLSVTEPLLSLTEFTNQMRYIVNAVQVQAIADGGPVGAKRSIQSVP